MVQLSGDAWPSFVETENGSLTVPDTDPLERMLIEHPSMSLYQRTCATNEEEEEVPGADGDFSGLVLHKFFKV